MSEGGNPEGGGGDPGALAQGEGADAVAGAPANAAAEPAAPEPQATPRSASPRSASPQPDSPQPSSPRVQTTPFLLPASGGFPGQSPAPSPAQPAPPGTPATPGRAPAGTPVRAPAGGASRAPVGSKFMIGVRGPEGPRGPPAARLGAFRAPTREEQRAELAARREAAETRARVAAEAIERRLRERVARAEEEAERQRAEEQRRLASLGRAEELHLQRRLGILLRLDESERRVSAFQERRRAELEAARDRSREREEAARRAVALAEDIRETRERVAALAYSGAVERARAEGRAQEDFWYAQGLSRSAPPAPGEERHHGRVYRLAPRIYRGEGGVGAPVSKLAPSSPREAPAARAPPPVPIFLDEEPLVRASERVQERRLFGPAGGALPAPRALRASRPGALSCLFRGPGGGPRALADGRAMVCVGEPAPGPGP